MSIAVLEGVSLSFGKKSLLERLNLRIASGDRVGLIGPNGSGKSSLLKLLAGEQTPDCGTVLTSRAMRIGYLPQDVEVLNGNTLWNFVRDSIAGREELKTALVTLEAELEGLRAGRDEADRENNSRAMELGRQVSELHDRLAHYELNFSEHRALRILAGLGFREEDRDRGLKELSGGWRIRAKLASLLFQQPDLLLLDEPTNHLDMPSVAWLAGFLQRYRRAFVLVCHDREFLNEQIERVVSLEPEGVRQYRGNYDAYLGQRSQERLVLDNQAENLRREREQAERFIRRFRAQASKARAVQSRIKALERMPAVEGVKNGRVMRFSFPPCRRSGREAIRLSGVEKSFGSHKVFADLNLTVQRGERIGVIGANGAGKTTLLKLMAGELEPDAGRIELGHNVSISYFGQELAEALDPKATVFQQVAQRDPESGATRVRSLLGALLFSGDEADKPVGVLSGGERARAALAALLISPGNLLLMDEPTTHLDLNSGESLTEALSTYDGTLVFITHNRGLVRRLATRIWDVAGGKVETYPGTFDEYLDSYRVRSANLEAEPDNANNHRGEFTSGPRARREPESRGWAADKERKRREALLRAERRNRTAPLEKKVAELESEIARLEELQKERVARMADRAFYTDSARAPQVVKDYQNDKNRIERLTREWEAAQKALDEAKRAN